jgi:hypothetical protein
MSKYVKVTQWWAQTGTQTASLANCCKKLLKELNHPNLVVINVEALPQSIIDLANRDQTHTRISWWSTQRNPTHILWQWREPMATNKRRIGKTLRPHPKTLCQVWLLSASKPFSEQVTPEDSLSNCTAKYWMSSYCQSTWEQAST